MQGGEEAERRAACQRLELLARALEERETFLEEDSWMRTTELVARQEGLDDAHERLFDAVRDARRLGLDWATIAGALGQPEDEVTVRYRQVDRM